MMTAKSSQSLPSQKDINHQLEAILASPDFTATPQQVCLLRYVVEQTLAGNAESIKGYTIATEVFGRRSDFDQNIDPIVSIQAGRLRRALSRYYRGAGKSDPLRIDIPKGGYVPVFETRKHPQMAAVDSAPPKSPEKTRARRYWPTVLVRPVQNVSGDPELQSWVLGLAAELADELNRYPDIRVMTLDADETADDQSSACFIIDGSVRSDSDYIKVILNLTDVRTGRQIWSSSCRSEVENGSVIAFQERIARMAAVKVAGKRGWIAKTVSREFQNGGPPNSEAYAAVFRY